MFQINLDNHKNQNVCKECHIVINLEWGKKIKALKCHLKHTLIKLRGRQRTEIERKIGKKKNVTKVPKAEKHIDQKKNPCNQN
jgi:hypothetical protein